MATRFLVVVFGSSSHLFTSKLSSIQHVWRAYNLPPCLRLVILCILRGKQDDFACHFGIKCSSFSKMNVGTSMRSPHASMGYGAYPSVSNANTLLERTLCSSYPEIFIKMECTNTTLLSWQDLLAHHPGDRPRRLLDARAACWFRSPVLPCVPRYHPKDV